MRVDDLVLESVEPIPPFTFKWPDGKTVEAYDTGWRATAVVDGKSYAVRHGLTNRVTYGRSRRRATTWINQSFLEGVACDDYELSRCLASLITRDKKVLTESAQVGAAYEGFNLVRYKDEVTGKAVYSWIAAKIREDDVR